MSGNNSDSTAVSTVLFFAAAAWIAFTWRPSSEEVTVYRALCPDGMVSGVCRKGEGVAERTTYRVDLNTENVTVWSDMSTPFKFTNCAIQDKENWSCTDAGRFGVTRLMTNGSMVDSSGDFSYEVSKWRWWLLRAQGWARQKA